MIGATQAGNAGIAQTYFEKNFPVRKEEPLFPLEDTGEIEEGGVSGKGESPREAAGKDFSEIMRSTLRRESAGQRVETGSAETGQATASHGPRLSNDFWQLQML